ncbi:hypothetical protein OYT1_ch1882 [Ferriphaselus amnicola]|uniref:Uncharacterized protein n=1 Tax=Ferriphaselus amnicola TaxID=1188319 RepID=A0A2Z6GDK2_9PROT|nr:hypothetical protein OYT1_ch1882 [Ferriphaselus amnicola]
MRTAAHTRIRTEKLDEIGFMGADYQGKSQAVSIQAQASARHRTILEA